MLLVGGLLLLTVFAVYELRFSRDPILDLHMFKDYNFTIASIITWFTFMFIFGSLFLLPIFLESVRSPHLSAAAAGLTLMSQGLAAVFAVALSGKFLYDRLGVRLLALIGGIMLLVSAWQLSHLTTSSDEWSLLP
jgi:hypothetical protein